MAKGTSKVQPDLSMRFGSLQEKIFLTEALKKGKSFFAAYRTPGEGKFFLRLFYAGRRAQAGADKIIFNIINIVYSYCGRALLR
jgi:hypothetical protein